MSSNKYDDTPPKPGKKVYVGLDIRREVAIDRIMKEKNVTREEAIKMLQNSGSNLNVHEHVREYHEKSE